MGKKLAVFTVAVVVAAAAGLLAAHAQPVATIALPEPGAAKELYPGCNAVAVTFPDGTSSQTVANAVSPAGSLQAIWSYDTAQQRFTAFSPAAPQASDLLSVDFLDAVWVCLAGVPLAPSATPNAVSVPPTSAIPPPPVSSPAAPQPPSDDDLQHDVYRYGVTGAAWFFVSFENLNPTWSVCGLVFRVDVLDTRLGIWLRGEEIEVGTLAPLEAVDWPRQSIVHGVTGVQDYRIMADWTWCWASQDG